MNAPITYRLRQILPDGSQWASAQAYTHEQRQVIQAVIAGFLFGQPRAAVEEGTGKVVFAVDGKGLANAAAKTLFAGPA